MTSETRLTPQELRAALALSLIFFLRMLGLFMLLPVLALWPMDVLQMRALREPEVQRGVLIGGVLQEIKYLGACIVMGCLGLGSRGTSQDLGDAWRGDSPGILRRD